MVRKFFKNKKTLAGLAFMVILFLLTVSAILRGESLESIVEAMVGADPGYIVLSVVCVIVFLFIQGISIRISLRALGQKTNMFHCTLYSFTGFFYCCITPFQIGGPPMQVFYMRKEDIPVPVSSAVLLVVAAMYKVVLVVVGILVLIFGARYTLGPLWEIMPIYGIGMLFTVAFCTFLGLLIFHPNLARRFLVKTVTVLTDKHILRFKEDRISNLNKAMDKYKETAAFFKEHGALMVVIFLLSFVQRFVLYTSTYFVYLALGLGGTGWFQIVVFQAIISLCVDMLPVPGGVGISEYIFTVIFAGIFTGGTLIPGLVLSRGIAYYVQLIICAVIAVFTHLHFRQYAEDRARMMESGEHHS